MLEFWFRIGFLPTLVAATIAVVGTWLLDFDPLLGRGWFLDTAADGWFFRGTGSDYRRRELFTFWFVHFLFYKFLFVAFVFSYRFLWSSSWLPPSGSSSNCLL